MTVGTVFARGHRWLIPLLLGIGCTPADPLDGLLRAIEPHPLPDAVRYALPDDASYLVIRRDRAERISPRDHKTVALSGSDVDDLLWEPLLLGVEAPLVVAVDRSARPGSVAGATVAARALSPVGFGFGPLGEVEPLGAATLLYDDVADPLVFGAYPRARAAALGPVRVAPRVLEADDRAALARIEHDIAARPDRHALFEALFREARARAPDSEAAIWLATALVLGGTAAEDLGLVGPAAEEATVDAARFRQTHPVPRITSPAARRAVSRDRWATRALAPSVARDLGRSLTERPTLLARLRAERALDALLFGASPLPDPTESTTSTLLSRPDPVGGFLAQLDAAYAEPTPASPHPPPLLPLTARPGPTTAVSPEVHTRLAAAFDALGQALPAPLGATAAARADAHRDFPDTPVEHTAARGSSLGLTVRVHASEAGLSSTLEVLPGPVDCGSVRPEGLPVVATRSTVVAHLVDAGCKPQRRAADRR